MWNSLGMDKAIEIEVFKIEYFLKMYIIPIFLHWINKQKLFCSIWIHFRFIRMFLKKLKMMNYILKLENLNLLLIITCTCIGIGV